MGIFNLFKKQHNPKKGFEELRIKEVQTLTKDSVKITFELKDEIKQNYVFQPGQYIDIEATINDVKIRRSYSICSTTTKELSIGVKEINNGKMSTFLNQVKQGEILAVSAPKGNFIAAGNEDHIVCIAAGSGITPIISLLSNSSGKKELFFVNKSLEHMMFKEELLAMPDLTNHFYFTQKNEEGYGFGRLTKDLFISEIKTNLSLLKANIFFVCGPQEMVKEIKDALKMFGISDSKIKIELFQATVTDTPNEEVVFSGESMLKVVLDGEISSIPMVSSKKTILESLEAKGIDAPYSCRGGVCCSCKAKVTEGKVKMKVNYSLTDEEVEQGYVLTCQALPASAEINLSFDE